ncbi:thioredoxin-like protein [Aspergillus californicus]
MAHVLELTSLDDYNAALEKPGLVVVDFYSTQCPPCKVVAPIYEQIASKETNGDVAFFKVINRPHYHGTYSNIMKVNGLVEPGSAIQQAAEVVWWPTFVVYEDGQEVWRRKVPNPPSLQPVHELGDHLDGRKQHS